ncbi:hypothetical protein [Mesorhizobium sp.]|nr:hypothetical protein [Mesorhizobium sp.]
MKMLIGATALTLRTYPKSLWVFLCQTVAEQGHFPSYDVVRLALLDVVFA